MARDTIYPEDKNDNEDGLAYQEKSVIVSLLTSTLVYALFAVLVWQRYRAESFDAASVLVLSLIHIYADDPQHPLDHVYRRGHGRGHRAGVVPALRL